MVDRTIASCAATASMRLLRASILERTPACIVVCASAKRSNIDRNKAAVDAVDALDDDDGGAFSGAGGDDDDEDAGTDKLVDS